MMIQEGTPSFAKGFKVQIFQTSRGHLKSFKKSNTPEDGQLGPKHVVSKVRVYEKEQFVALLTGCVVYKRFYV